MRATLPWDHPWPMPSAFTPSVLDGVQTALSLLPRRRLRTDPDTREAAVLVSLCDVDNVPSVLFTKRSERVGTHKGQVSFPGGMRDDDDFDFAACALREMEEEIGVPRGQPRVLGAFHEAFSITQVRVVPIVAYLGAIDPAALVLSEAEIDTVFTLSLAELAAPDNRRRQDGGRYGPMPFFEAGPHPVWGLTAFILDGFLREVLGPLVVSSSDG